MPEFDDSDTDFVYFSGKQAEEIGFKKFHQRQAKLQGIRVLVLDHMRIKHRQLGQDDVASITEMCADITDLDVSGNLFETFDEIAQLCSLLPKLSVLTLDGNRFTVHRERIHISLQSVKTLSLSQTLLNQAEVNKLVTDNATPILPSLSSLNLSNNELRGPLKLELSLSTHTVDLSGNDFSALSDLPDLDVNCPSLHTLVLKHNRISTVCKDPKALADFAMPVVELDLSYNAIDSFSFFNGINKTTFPGLKHLRVTGNNLYKTLVSAEGKPLTAEDGYMLTIAHIPQLEYLNYGRITEKERLNAETYYLGQIATELSNAPTDKRAEVIARHPRWKELCEEYGEPSISHKQTREEVNPNSLAARLVNVTFALAPGVLPRITQRFWSKEVPKSFNIYVMLGMVGKYLEQMPLNIRLILETEERDPVGRDSGYGGPEWWDSSDDEAEAEEEWVKREVEMVAGTRALGTFIEGAEANIRVEMRHGGE